MVRSLADVIAIAIAFIPAIAIHEFAHAFVADQLGDPTPRNQGRLTLNPMAHLDPLGTILIFIAGFGWGKPVNVNPRYLPGDFRGMAIVSAAGPISNVLLAALFAIPIRFGATSLLQAGSGNVFFPSLGEMYTQIIYINVLLAVFNLLPFAPLDGSKVLLGLLPPRLSYQVAQYQQYGPLILLGLIFFVPFFLRVDLLSAIIGPPIRIIFQLLIGAPVF